MSQKTDSASQDIDARFGNRDLVLGVDPGFFGGLALYRHSEKKLVDVVPMPIKRSKGISNRFVMDRQGLALFFDRYASQIKYAIVEEVGAMPGQGVTSMFRFGEAYGMVQGVIVSYYLPHLLVSPWTWKMMMGLNRDKDLSIKKASELFPSWSKHFEGKKTDGLAEAALMAVYGALYTFRQKAS